MSDIISRFTAAGAEEYTADVRKMADATDELNTSTKQAETQQKSLRTQLREVTQELARQQLAGKANTEEYKKLRDEAGKLKDAMADAAEEIAQAGSDTRGLDKALRATSVLVGGFTAVQGAAALFGNESENLQKTLLKVNAAMSILNGLQAIQAELIRRDSLFTSAAAKAKELYARFTTTATAATKLFTAALGGGLLLALGLVITNFDKIVGWIKRYTDSNYEAKKSLEAFLKTQKQQNDELEYEIRLRRAKGEDEKILLADEARGKENAVKNLDAQIKKQKELLAIEQKGRQVRQRDDVITVFDTKEINRLKGVIDDLEARKKASVLTSAEADKALRDLLARKPDEGAKEQVQELTKEIDKARVSLRDSTYEGKKGRDQEIEGLETIQATTIETGDLKANVDDAELKRSLDYSKQKVAANKAENEEIRWQDRQTFKERSALAQQAFDVAARFEQSLSQIVDNSLAIQQQNLENKRAKGLITEKQYAKEIAKLQQKQLKASKATGIVEATINGAVAALKAFAELGPIGGAIAAALIAGITATQIALIAKQKIPTIPGFFKGTKDAPPGMKWVGEKGPELVNDKGGYAIIPAGESQRIADMYKKWDVPTITVPELIRQKPAYQPPSADRLQKIVFQQNNTEMVTELKFIGNWIRQGNGTEFKSLEQLKAISDKLNRRGFRT